MSEQLEQFARIGNVRKFLDMISDSEGTSKHGYRTAFGGGLLPSLSDHPRYLKSFTQTDGKSNKTSAAGRYQFIRPTWDGLAKRYGFKDFGARNQDLGAIALLKESGALPYVLKGDWQGALNKSGKIWASLPTSTAPQKTRSTQYVMQRLGAPMQAQQPKQASQEQIRAVLAKAVSERQQQPQNAQPQQANPDQIRSILKAEAEKKRNESFGNKTASRIGSAAGGMMNAFSGLKQGMDFIDDSIGKGLNAVLPGDPFPTDKLANTNQKIQARDQMLQDAFVKSGRGSEGQTDVLKLGGNIAASVPAFMVGGGAGTGAKALGQFAGRQGAIGAGVGAAQYAEDGGDRLGNMTGGAIGGAVGGVIGEKVLAPAVKTGLGAVARRLPANKARTEAQINTESAQIAKEAAKLSGKKLSGDELGNTVKLVRTELMRGKSVSPATLANRLKLSKVGLADKATQAQLTKDPIIWQNEVALSKRAGIGDDIRAKYVQDSQDITDLGAGLVDDLGGRPVDDFAVGESMQGAFNASDDAARQQINDLYATARAQTGNEATLNGQRFVNEASRELDAQGLGSYLKGDINSIMKGVFEGRGADAFNITKAQELVKILNKRSKLSNDPAERYAYGIVRKNLEKEMIDTLDEMMPNMNVNGSGAEATDAATAAGVRSVDEADAALEAWKTARDAAKSRFETIDSTPAYKAAIEGVQPDKFFDRFIVRGNQKEVEAALSGLKGSDDALGQVRAQVVNKIFDKATGTNGQISPATLTREINKIGWRKLGTVLGKEKAVRLKEIVDAADVLMTEPRKSAVNHSNTASEIANNSSRLTQRAMQMLELGKYVPLIAESSKNITDKLVKRQANKTLSGTVGMGRYQFDNLSPTQKRLLELAGRGTSTGSAATGSN